MLEKDLYSFKTRNSSAVASLLWDFRALLGEFWLLSSSAFTDGRVYVDGVSRREYLDPREKVGVTVGGLVRLLVRGLCFLGLALEVEEGDRVTGVSMDVRICFPSATPLGAETLPETLR